MEGFLIGIASGFGVNALQKVFKKVSSAVKEKESLVRSLDKNINFLRGELPAVKNLILDAYAVISNVEMPSQGGPFMSKEFLKGLRKFVYDGEDIVDEFDMEADRGHLDNKRKRKIAVKLKELYHDFEELKESNQNAVNFLELLKDNLGRVHGDEDDSGLPLSREPSMSTIQRKDIQIVGRETEKTSLVSDLLGNKSKPSVMLLTGMGGIGKTTLAHAVLKDPQIVRHFAIRKWVTVGDQNLDPKKVLEQMVDGVSTADNSLDEAKEKVRAELEGEKKRFLIVLDDVWDAEDLGNRWIQLWAPLSCGGEGSRVVVTTREEQVKCSMQALPVEVRKLGLLSNEECLQIFEAFAFPDGSDTSSSFSSSSSSSSFSAQELEMVSKKRIGKRIIDEKVKGVPLAARIMGSSLRGRGVRYWEAAVAQIKARDIDSAILWSYLNLPMHPKQCFALCSLFPKDTPLDKTSIVRLWMAHSFAVRSDGPLYGETTTLVAIGESYFDYLLRASLVQVDEVAEYERGREDAKVVECYYKMHDLIRDFASRILGEEFSEEGKEQQPQTLRRHFIATQRFSLRGFMLRGPDHLFDSRMGQLTTARSLCIDRDYSIHLPEIFLTQLFKKLSHVRYLDISGIRFSNLPESVCSMYALQTLILCKKKQNVQTIGFPNTMAKQLFNLYHIEAGHNVSRISGLGQLTKLHSIGGRFLLEEDNWQSIEELRNLKQLRGSLEIEGLGHVRCSQLVCKQQLLENLGNLKVLAYDMSGVATSEVLDDYLQPPGNVEDLEIKNYRMDHLPTWLGNVSFNVVSLRLLYCSVKKLPPLGHLPLLECLFLEGMHELEEIDEKIPSSLKYLRIYYCDNLRALPKELPPSLQVSVEECVLLHTSPEEY